MIVVLNTIFLFVFSLKANVNKLKSRDHTFKKDFSHTCLLSGKEAVPQSLLDRNTAIVNYLPFKKENVDGRTSSKVY